MRMALLCSTKVFLCSTKVLLLLLLLTSTGLQGIKSKLAGRIVLLSIKIFSMVHLLFNKMGRQLDHISFFCHLFGAECRRQL